MYVRKCTPYRVITVASLAFKFVFTIGVYVVHLGKEKISLERDFFILIKRIINHRFEKEMFTFLAGSLFALHFLDPFLYFIFKDFRHF